MKGDEYGMAIFNQSSVLEVIPIVNFGSRVFFIGEVMRLVHK